MADCNRGTPKPSDATQPLDNGTGITTGLPVLTAEDISNAMKRTVWPVTIVIGVEAVLGIIGNTLIIIVYSLRYRRCNFKYFVLCMALIDITSCFTTLPMEMVSQMYWYNYQHDWICKIKSYFNVVTVWSSALALLLLAYDRYRKICWPLDWQIQPSWALRSCVISVVISSIVATPIIILWGKQSYIYKGNNQNITVSICEKSGFYADGMYPFLFIVAAYMVPILIMICITYVLNFKIAKAIFITVPVSQNSHDKMTHSDAHEILTLDGENACAFQHILRRNSEVVTPCINEHISCRLSTSMNLQQKEDQSSDVKTESRDISFTALTSRDPDNVGYDNSVIHDQSAIRYFMNGYPQERNENGSALCQSSRPRSYSSSESSEYIILKHSKRRFLSTFPKWHSPFARRRISEIDRSEVDDIVESRHACIRRETKSLPLKRKTKIMLVLTTVFNVTIIIYLVLSCLVANQESILKELTKREKVIFFLFWRFYFINCVINPVLYGLMDPRFRKGVKEIFHLKTLSRKRTCSSKSLTSHVTVV